MKMFMYVQHVKLSLVGRGTDFISRTEVRARFHKWATDRCNGGKRGL